MKSKRVFLYHPSSGMKNRGGIPVGILLAILVLLNLNACTQSPPRESATYQQELAQTYTQQGAAAKDPKKAQELFEKAIRTDTLYGPAYNNLGVLLLEQKKYYEAASAFDQAIKLMPYDPAPRFNLSLVYDAAGRYQDALEQLTQALVIAPELIDAMQLFTRIQIQQDQITDQTPKYLQTITIRGTSDQWQQWAKLQLVKLDARF